MKHRPQFTNLQAVRVQDLRLDVEERVGDAGESGAERVDVALGGGERVVHPGGQFSQCEHFSLSYAILVPGICPIYPFYSSYFQVLLIKHYSKFELRAKKCLY